VTTQAAAARDEHRDLLDEVSRSTAADAGTRSQQPAICRPRTTSDNVHRVDAGRGHRARLVNEGASSPNRKAGGMLMCQRQLVPARPDIHAYPPTIVYLTLTRSRLHRTPPGRIHRPSRFHADPDVDDDALLRLAGRIVRRRVELFLPRTQRNTAVMRCWRGLIFFPQGPGSAEQRFGAAPRPDHASFPDLPP